MQEEMARFLNWKEGTKNYQGKEEGGRREVGKRGGEREGQEGE